MVTPAFEAKREQPIMKTDLELLIEVKQFCSIKTDLALAKRIGLTKSKLLAINAGELSLTDFEKIRCYCALRHKWAIDALFAIGSREIRLSTFEAISCHDFFGHAWAKEALTVLFPGRVA